MGKTGGGRGTNGHAIKGTSTQRAGVPGQGTEVELDAPLADVLPQRLTTARQIEMLNVLVDRLVAKGITARIYVIGGAAAGMAYYPEGVDRRASSDIDALFSPEGPVLDEAAEMAEEHGLPTNWFNGAAGQFIPPTGEPPGESFITRGSVTVTIAPPEFLLAMKLRASRMGRDDEDIAVLVRRCGIRSVAEAEDLVAQVYDGEEEIPRARRAVIEAVLGEYELRRSLPPVTLPPVT